MFWEQSCHLFGERVANSTCHLLICGCLTVFVWFALWCWGLNKDLIVNKETFKLLLCC